MDAEDRELIYLVFMLVTIGFIAVAGIMMISHNAAPHLR